MPQLTRVTAASEDAVLMSLVKSSLGLPQTAGADDDFLEALIDAAVEDVQSFTGRTLITETWRAAWDRDELRLPPWTRGDEDDRDLWDGPFDFRLQLPRALVSGISSVKAYDSDGNETSLASEDYSLVNKGDDAELYVRSSILLDLRPTQCVVVEMTCGMAANASAVPPLERRALLKLIAYDYEHRGDSDAPERESILCSSGLVRQIRI